MKNKNTVTLLAKSCLKSISLFKSDNCIFKAFSSMKFPISFKSLPYNLSLAIKSELKKRITDDQKNRPVKFKLITITLCMLNGK